MCVKNVKKNGLWGSFPIFGILNDISLQSPLFLPVRVGEGKISTTFLRDSSSVHANAALCVWCCGLKFQRYIVEQQCFGSVIKPISAIEPIKHVSFFITQFNLNISTYVASKEIVYTRIDSQYFNLSRTLSIHTFTKTQMKHYPCKILAGIVLKEKINIWKTRYWDKLQHTNIMFKDWSTLQ